MEHSIPQLFCPIPYSVHPGAEDASRSTEQWLQRHKLDTHVASQTMRDLHLGELAALTHATVTVNDLQLYTDWCSWLFIHDDMGDSMTPANLQILHADVLRILRDAERVKTDAPLLNAMRDLWQRTSSRAPSEQWRGVFLSNVQDFFDAGVWEAENRDRGSLIDLESYVQRRRRTSGMYMWIDLIEISGPTLMPDAVRKHAEMQRATTMVNDIASWANDIFSLGKELASNDPFNLVLVIAHNDHIPLNRALEKAIALHDDRVRSFLDTEILLRSLGTAYSIDLSWYVDRLRSYVRGNLDWMIHATNRYLQR
jgi:hypothetical protein